MACDGKLANLTDVTENVVGVIGARSLVGERLLAMRTATGAPVVAFTRHAVSHNNTNVVTSDVVTWRRIDDFLDPQNAVIEDWISLAPIWSLPQMFPMLEAFGVRRLVALSSTSRFTKQASSAPAEREIARRLATAEDALQQWAQARGLACRVLRPTLIYGCGRDGNIAEIARFIRRFGFFPVFGDAMGLRQPVHADDVAAVCLAALQHTGSGYCASNLGGGETLAYREMVRRIFGALDRAPRLVTVPLWAFRLLLRVARLAPRYRHWHAAMAERMNQDMVFDIADLGRELGWRPRGFWLGVEDVAGVAKAREKPPWPHH